jgi:hypothetical protein
MPLFFFLSVVVASAAGAEGLVGYAVIRRDGEMALSERYTFRVGAAKRH